MNTDPLLFKDTSYIHESIEFQRRLSKSCPSVFEISTFSDPPWPGFYGYDYTQYALDAALDSRDDQADYFLFTNGDNLFNEGMFLNVLPFFRNQSDLVAFSFVSHHVRQGNRNNVISVKYERQNIDLSSVFFSKRVLLENRESANFVPEGQVTQGTFYADWQFISRMMEGKAKAAIAPGVLLFHQ
jgi:hypothetical protein